MAAGLSEERKAKFLESLRSPSDPSRYKRYRGAPIRYAGGKSLVAGLVLEKLPAEVEKVVSPFFGGGQSGWR